MNVISGAKHQLDESQRIDKRQYQSRRDLLIIAQHFSAGGSINQSIQSRRDGWHNLQRSA